MVSAQFASPETAARAEPSPHVVQLYGDDQSLLTRSVAQYLAEGLKQREAVVVIATAEHTRAFEQRLLKEGHDLPGASQAGRLVFLDAQETLDTFMMDGQPEWGRFESRVGGILRTVRKQAEGGQCRAYGEMVGLLWQNGQYSAALKLEVSWNALMKANAFRLFCAYPIDILSNEFQISTLHSLLCAHTHLVSANDQLEGAVDRALQEVLGSKAHDLRQLIEAMSRPSWAQMPRAEATILWLRNLLPDAADEILGRVRRYYLEARSGPEEIPAA